MNARTMDWLSRPQTCASTTQTCARLETLALPPVATIRFLCTSSAVLASFRQALTCQVAPLPSLTQSESCHLQQSLTPKSQSRWELPKLEVSSIRSSLNLQLETTLVNTLCKSCLVSTTEILLSDRRTAKKVNHLSSMLSTLASALQSSHLSSLMLWNSLNFSQRL